MIEEEEEEEEEEEQKQEQEKVQKKTAHIEAINLRRWLFGDGSPRQVLLKRTTVKPARREGSRDKPSFSISLILEPDNGSISRIHSTALDGLSLPLEVASNERVRPLRTKTRSKGTSTLRSISIERPLRTFVVYPL